MLQSRGLIDFKGVDSKNVLELFQLAKTLKKSKKSTKEIQGKIAALVFFEPSTRTRVSFEVACHHSGFKPVLLDSVDNSSLSKGESTEDTIENMASMDVDLFIIRAGKDFNFRSMTERISQPMINAGWSVDGHPTQALLDSFTLWEKNPDLSRQKVVVIGDVDHSRVASSHKELGKILGYEVKFCGPSEWTKTVSDSDRIEFDEAINSATTLMFLRVQKERHGDLQQNYSDFAQSYAKNFGLNQNKWSRLKSNQIIMHPGPVNYGIEIDQQTARHPQSVILEQVRNGVYVRQALLEQVKGVL